MNASFGQIKQGGVGEECRCQSESETVEMPMETLQRIKRREEETDRRRGDTSETVKNLLQKEKAGPLR